MPAKLYTTNTYSQGSKYGTTNSWAGWANMNDFNPTTGTATASSQTDSWVQTDLGSVKKVEYIVIGYDSENAIPGGWGVSYSISGPGVGLTYLALQDNLGSTHTTITLPSYDESGSPASGLAPVAVNKSCRYLRIFNPSTYFAITEFQVWVAPASGGFFHFF